MKNKSGSIVIFLLLFILIKMAYGESLDKNDKEINKFVFLIISKTDYENVSLFSFNKEDTTFNEFMKIDKILPKYCPMHNEIILQDDNTYYSKADSCFYSKYYSGYFDFSKKELILGSWISREDINNYGLQNKAFSNPVELSPDRKKKIIIRQTLKEYIFFIKDQSGNEFHKKRFPGTNNINAGWLTDEIIVFVGRQKMNVTEIVDLQTGDVKEINGNIIGVAHKGYKYFLITETGNGPGIYLKDIRKDFNVNEYEFVNDEGFNTAFLIGDYCILVYTGSNFINFPGFARIIDVKNNKVLFNYRPKGEIYFLGAYE